MAKFKDFVSYPKDVKEKGLVPVEKQSKSSRTTDEALSIDLPQSAMVNVVAFRGFIKSELHKIEKKNIGLRWLDTLKAKSVVKNQRAFLEEIRKFEQEDTAWIKDKTERTTAETEHVDAETKKRIAEHRHANIGKDLLIGNKEQDVKLAELEYQESKWKEKTEELKRPKTTSASLEEPKPKVKTEREKLQEEGKTKSHRREVLEQFSRQEEMRYEAEWKALCDTKDPPWPYWEDDAALLNLSDYERKQWKQQFHQKEALKTKVRERILTEE